MPQKGNVIVAVHKHELTLEKPRTDGVGRTLLEPVDAPGSVLITAAPPAKYDVLHFNLTTTQLHLVQLQNDRFGASMIVSPHPRPPLSSAAAAAQ